MSVAARVTAKAQDSGGAVGDTHSPQGLCTVTGRDEAPRPCRGRSRGSGLQGNGGPLRQPPCREGYRSEQQAGPRPPRRRAPRACPPGVAPHPRCDGTESPEPTAAPSPGPSPTRQKLPGLCVVFSRLGGLPQLLVTQEKGTSPAEPCLLPRSGNPAVPDQGGPGAGPGVGLSLPLGSQSRERGQPPADSQSWLQNE